MKMVNKNNNYLHDVEELSSNNIKYILSIGKRQPMHIGHKKSLARIIDIPGVKLIYVMGSSNLKGDPLFDPLTNPLNIEQQIKQFQIAFPEEDPIFLPIKDIKDMSLWGEIIIAALADLNIKPSECAVHFIGKEEDKLLEGVQFSLKTGDSVTLEAGQWLIEALIHWGFYIWLDKVKDVDLTISARKFRKLDLENLSEENKNLLVAPEYLRELAIQARDSNPNKENLKNISITLHDLTLLRK